jgi:hypothetical protein
MHLALIFIGFSLLGQAAQGDVMTEALALPQGAGVSGQSMTLLSALATTNDRRQQLEIAHAYWRLVEAVADYHFAWNYDNQIKRLKVPSGESAALRAAQAAAVASLLEAELTVNAAQYELAALVRFPDNAALPLPADPPHVGPYTTYFAELYANKPAPVQAKIIDRNLPVRLRAIEQHLLAVKAADEAMESTLDDMSRQRAALVDFIAAAKEDLQQRQALAAAVCRYNWEIADYAMMVVPSGISPQMLVARLIRQPQGSVSPTAAKASSGVQPAGHNEPTPAIRPTKTNEPTPAIRPAERKDPMLIRSQDDDEFRLQLESSEIAPRGIPDADASALPIRPLVPIDPLSADR